MPIFRAWVTCVKSYYGPLGTGHYLPGGEGYYVLGEGHNFFSLTFGRAVFFKNDFEGRATNFLAHKYSVSIYPKSSHSQFSLFEPTVSVLPYLFE